MILSDKAIMSLIQKGTLSISPLQDNQIQPASVDIRLGNTFSVVEDSSTGILTFAHEIVYKEINAETYLLLPGQLVFAQMDQATQNPYCGKYQGQRGATGSKVYLDEESDGC